MLLSNCPISLLGFLWSIGKAPLNRLCLLCKSLGALSHKSDKNQNQTTKFHFNLLYAVGVIHTNLYNLAIVQSACI